MIPKIIMIMIIIIIIITIIIRMTVIAYFSSTLLHVSYNSPNV